MTLYRVSRIVRMSEMIKFLERNIGTEVHVEAISEEQEVAQSTPAPAASEAVYTPERGLRKPRRSKVNEAILDCLKRGHGSPANLRSALENAGLAASSLTTGLIALQKAGTVKRGADGHYSLVPSEAAQEPAEAAE